MMRSHSPPRCTLSKKHDVSKISVFEIPLSFFLSQSVSNPFDIDVYLRYHDTPQDTFFSSFLSPPLPSPLSLSPLPSLFWLDTWEPEGVAWGIEVQDLLANLLMFLFVVRTFTSEMFDTCTRWKVRKGGREGGREGGRGEDRRYQAIKRERGIRRESGSTF